MAACAFLPFAAAHPASAQGPPAQADAAPAQPDAETIVTLVRTSLLTLNDAVRTGNFTVLRDVGAPKFRDANTAARLAQIFSPLMRDGIDLSRVAVASPQLSEAPSLHPGGMLVIRGSVEAGKRRLDFALQYQSIQGRWRLFGLSAHPAATPAASARAPRKKEAAGFSAAQPAKKVEGP